MSASVRPPATPDGGGIVPPIFVDPDLPLLFESVAEAEDLLDPADLGPDEKGYDGEGRLLRVRVVRRFGKGADGTGEVQARVEITAAEERPTHLEDLRQALASWLGRTSSPRADLSRAALADLIGMARERSRMLTGGSGITPVLAFLGVVAGLFIMPALAVPVEWLQRLGQEPSPGGAGRAARFLTYLPLPVAGIAIGLVLVHAAAYALPPTRACLLADAKVTSLRGYLAAQRSRLLAIGMVVVASLALAAAGAPLLSLALR
jgi:hypothetical protein